MAVLPMSHRGASLPPSAERFPADSGLPGESLLRPVRPENMGVKLAAASATSGSAREVRICFLMARPFNEEQRGVLKECLALFQNVASLMRLTFP